MLNQIIHGDCFDILKDIPDNSIDAVITDPPYGIGLSHWDTVVDIPEFTREVRRVCNGFYSFFGQMPTVVDWINEANNCKLHYCEHISWVKRIATPSFRLSRGHESILIYACTNNKTFYKNKGIYEDVKLPGILFDTFTIDGLDRYVKDMWLKIKTGDFDRSDRSRGSQRQQEFNRFAGGGYSRSPRECNFTNVWSFRPPTQAKRDRLTQHPTRKPIEVMKRLIEMLAPENGTVLDPFCGSGTTAIACKELGRNYICIEKEKEYFDIACERVNQLRETVENDTDSESFNQKNIPEFRQLSLF